MRKHPLLAFVTAVFTCSIPGALSAAQATTTTRSIDQTSAKTMTSRSASLAARTTDDRQRTRAEIEARAKAVRIRKIRIEHDARNRAVARAKHARAVAEAKHARAVAHAFAVRAQNDAKLEAVEDRAATRKSLASAAKSRLLAVQPYVALGGVWASLRSCESHGDYAENTGNGYYGAYQFSLASWLTVGETGLPSEASAQVQDAAARALYARQGWHAWPTCSYRIGMV
jgi:hypothetical protein